jgi:hypothetical protein
MFFRRRMRNARTLYRRLRSLKSNRTVMREWYQQVSERQVQLLRAIEVLQDREIEYRRELRKLRSSAAYERAFVENEPLVSVTIPTWTNYRALVEIAIPSVLSQTYENFEIVIVGDAAPPETKKALASFPDHRIRYVNLPHRGPYPKDQLRRWWVAGVPAINEAAQLARGEWIAPLNDDDEFTPGHIEVLLRAALSSRSEVAYGKFVMEFPDREPYVTGVFPPEMDQFTWQAAIQHAGLRIFEMELGDGWFDRPGDWSLCRRMLVAGVRFTMVDEIVAHLYPAASAKAEIVDRT